MNTRAIEFVVSELDDNKFVLKNMISGEQETLSIEAVISAVK